MRGRGATITPGLVISITFNLIFLLLLAYQWKMTGIDRYYWWDRHVGCVWLSSSTAPGSRIHSENQHDAVLAEELDTVLKNSERAVQGMHSSVAVRLGVQ